MRPRKYLFVVMFLCWFTAIFTSVAWAVSAAPLTFNLSQPNGVKFSAQAKGDEWRNWTTTSDNYAILKDDGTGYWVYAQPDNTGFALGMQAFGAADANVVTLKKSSFRVGIDTPTGIKSGLIPRSAQNSSPVLNSVSSYSSGSASLSSSAEFTSGSQNVLVILVNFTNVSMTTSEAVWTNRFFGAAPSVKDYYSQVSCGKLNLVPAAESYGTANNGVVVVNLNYAHPNTRGSIDDRNRKITRDALIAANPYVNFAAFDANHDSAIQSNELHIVIVVAGYETAFGGTANACSPSIWGHNWDLGTGAVASPVLDGVVVADFFYSGSYIQVGELQANTAKCGTGPVFMATPGILVHELGHDFALPDEYDIDGSSNGIGNWGVMGTGSWNNIPGQKLGMSPAHPCAWDKSYLGWLTPVQVMGSAIVDVPMVENSNTVYQLLDNPGGVDWGWYNGIGIGEYFLVENRQKIGYDAGLPGSGILIWHINEAVTDTNLANANEKGVRLIALEQADGLFNLENKKNRGDVGDPYLPGKTFTDATIPNSRLYSKLSSNVSVVVNANTSAGMSVTMNDGRDVAYYYVNSFAGNNSWSGISATGGFPIGPKATIQAAIDAAGDGDVISVADGVYNENINFRGKSISVQSKHGAAVTIINGRALASVVSFVNGEGAGAVLEGFTLYNGSALNGGGINCSNSSPLIKRCIVDSNAASDNGGGIYCQNNSSPQIINCLLTYNSAANRGAGIFCGGYSAPAIINCTLSNNFSQNEGGALVSDGAAPKVVNSIFWMNTMDGSINEIVLFNNGSVDISYSDIFGGWRGVGNVGYYPFFAGGDDFHLAVNSACIDKATPNGASQNDLDGNKRPQGNGYDMGAYEYKF